MSLPGKCWIYAHCSNDAKWFREVRWIAVVQAKVSDKTMYYPIICHVGRPLCDGCKNEELFSLVKDSTDERDRPVARLISDTAVPYTGQRWLTHISRNVGKTCATPKEALDSASVEN